MMAGKFPEHVIKPEELEKFQREYFEYGVHDFGYQIPHLQKLAEGYHQRYKDSHGDDRNWTDALRAHALYNSIKARETEENAKAKWEKKAFEVQQTLWGEQVEIGLPYQQDLTERFAGNLESIRSNARQKLLPLHSLLQSELTPESEIELQKKALHISKECTDGLIELSRDIFNESVKLLKEKPPCPFSVVVFGSMAKGEATPYSDLEYLFLIKESSEANKRFFELLAITSYFLIGNLAETKLSYMAVPELGKWFEDTQINGFKIDGLSEKAGNIPTGNGLPGTKNKFIITPDELANKYIHVYNNPTDEALRGDLTAMLTYMKEVFSCGDGATDLLPKFNKRKNLVDPNLCRDQKNMEMLRTDIEKFRLKIGQLLLGIGFQQDVKQELYRYPSMVVFDLVIVLSALTEGLSSWETFKDLQSHGLISEDVHNSLSFLLASACYIRLSTYLHHGSHDDRVSVLQCKPGVVVDKSEPWYIPQPLLWAQCTKHFPLQRLLTKAASEEKLTAKEKITEQFTYFKADSAWVHVIFGQYRKALDIFKMPSTDIDLEIEAMSECELEKIEALAIVAFTYCQCRELSISNEMFLKVLDKIKQFARLKFSSPITHSGQDRKYYSPSLHVRVLTALSVNQFILGEYSASLKTGTQALKINSRFFPNDIEGKWIAILHQGATLTILDRFDEAEEKFLRIWSECLAHCVTEFQTQMNGIAQLPCEIDFFSFLSMTTEKPLHFITKSLYVAAFATKNLGELYEKTGKCELAKLYYLKANELFQKLLGANAIHEVNRRNLELLCRVHAKLHEKDKSLKYFHASLEIAECLGDAHAKVSILFTIGRQFTFVFQDYVEAQQYYIKAENICKEFFCNHPEDKKICAYLWTAIGQNYLGLKCYPECYIYFMRALKEHRKIYNGDNNSDVAHVLFLLGSTYLEDAKSKQQGRRASSNKKFRKADEHLKKALTIYETIQGKTANTLEITSCLIRLTITSKCLRKSSEAERYGKMAFEMLAAPTGSASMIDTENPENWLSPSESAGR